MNLGLAAAVFGTIFLAELPDKTMIATLLMGSRGNAKSVWVGASLAFAVQMALACTLGGFLHLLPHRAIEIVVTVLFLGGAAYLLFIPESEEIEEAEEDVSAVKPEARRKTLRNAFIVIFLAEFGDLTQILAASFTARSNQPITVFIASTLALVLVAALGAFTGKALLKVLPLERIRLIGGLVLAGLGIWSLVVLIRG